jgi:hypothetical protein
MAHDASAHELGDRLPPRCAECGWAQVLVAGPELGVQPAPDVVLMPPLVCGTGMSHAQIEAYVMRQEWRCRWCDLGHRRLDRVGPCPYCAGPWERAEPGEFPSGEPCVRLSCRCGCEAEWYPARGWGQTDDYRLNPIVIARRQAQTRDPAVCQWCGDPEFDFVNRPDGFFRRCLRCRAIHRW